MNSYNAKVSLKFNVTVSFQVDSSFNIEMTVGHFTLAYLLQNRARSLNMHLKFSVDNLDWAGLSWTELDLPAKIVVLGHIFQ